MEGQGQRRCGVIRLRQLSTPLGCERALRGWRGVQPRPPGSSPSVHQIERTWNNLTVRSSEAGCNRFFSWSALFHFSPCISQRCAMAGADHPPVTI